MKITVFGATGMVGKELVAQALYRGHKVKAFGRNVFNVKFPESPALEIITGALFDKNDVFSVVNGADIIFSAIGGTMDETDKTRSLGMQNIVAQMEKAGTRRIIAIGGMGVLSDSDGDFLLKKPGYPAQYLAVGEEHLKAYRSLEASGLDYTFICCPDIIDVEATGMFHTSADTVPEPNNYKIIKGDLALFMLNEAEKGNYLRKRVGISN